MHNQTKLRRALQSLLLGAIASLCATLAFSTSAHAYCIWGVRRFDDTGNLAPHADSIPVYVNVGAAVGVQNIGISKKDVAAAVLSALARYNEASVGLPKLEFVDYITTGDGVWPTGGGIVIQAEGLDGMGQCIVNPSGTWIGLFSPGTPTDAIQSRIRLRRPGCHPDNNEWSNDMSEDNDVESVLVHELGHALGLGHSNTPPTDQFCQGPSGPTGMVGDTLATMNSSSLGGVIGRYLWRDDLEGLRKLYNTPGVCLNSQDCGGETCVTTPIVVEQEFLARDMSCQIAQETCADGGSSADLHRSHVRPAPA